MADPAVQYEDGGPDTSVPARPGLTGDPTGSVLDSVGARYDTPPSRDFMGDIDARASRASAGIAQAADRKLGEDSYLRQTYGRQFEEDRDRMRRAFEVESKTADDPALTHPWNADKERAERIKGPLENFGSVGMIFALAASAFTKTPMTSALNAGAAAMNAMREGDELAYKSAYQAWKDNTELVKKRFDMERAVYDDANKLATTDLNAWRNQMEIAASQFGDEKLKVMAQNGMIPEVFQTLEARANSIEKAMKAVNDQTNFNLTSDLARDKLEQWKTENPPPPPDAPNEQKLSYGLQMRVAEHKSLLDAKKQVYESQHPTYGVGGLTSSKDQATRIVERTQQLLDSGEETDSKKAHARAANEVQAADAKARSEGAKEGKKTDATLSKEGIDLAANMLIKGNPAATTNVGRGAQGAANLDAIKNRAAEILKERGLSPEESATLINENTAGFMGDKRGATVLAQRTAQVTGASVVALNTMDRVLDASKKVSRTEFSDINKILLAGRERTGNPEVIEYGIALNTLVNNYARAIGAGNNALTNTARQEAHDNLQKYWSQGQIEVAVKQMKKELHDELKGAQEARKIWQEGGTPFPEEKDTPRLKVKTREEAEALAPGTKYETPDGRQMTR